MKIEADPRRYQGFITAEPTRQMAKPRRTVIKRGQSEARSFPQQ